MLLSYPSQDQLAFTWEEQQCTFQVNPKPTCTASYVSCGGSLDLSHPHVSEMDPLHWWPSVNIWGLDLEQQAVFEKQKYSWSSLKLWNPPGRAATWPRHVSDSRRLELGTVAETKERVPLGSWCHAVKGRCALLIEQSFLAVCPAILLEQNVSLTED